MQVTTQKILEVNVIHRLSTDIILGYYISSLVIYQGCRVPKKHSRGQGNEKQNSNTFLCP